MRKLLFAPVVLMLGPLAGCVVAPTRAVPPPGVYYAAPPGVVYVAPVYVIPGPGYVWAYNMNYGWGWHHPHNGWHRGWR